MNRNWEAYSKISQSVLITKFDPSMAAKVQSEEGFEIYWIRTREGLRMIDSSMYIADKGNGYIHPMSPETLAKHYVPAKPDLIDTAVAMCDEAICASDKDTAISEIKTALLQLKSIYGDKQDAS